MGPLTRDSMGLIDLADEINDTAQLGYFLNSTCNNGHVILTCVVLKLDEIHGPRHGDMDINL